MPPRWQENLTKTGAALLGAAVPGMVLRSVPTFVLLAVGLLVGLVTTPKARLWAVMQASVKSPLATLVAAFLLFTVLVTPWALNPFYALHFWKILLLLVLVAWLLNAVVACLPVARQQQVWRWLIGGMWASLAVALVIVMFEPKFIQWHVYDQGNAWTQTRLRYYSSVLAVYLPFCWVAWLAPATPPATLMERWRPWLLIGVTLIGVILCAGRAGWLGAGAALVVCVALLWRYHTATVALGRAVVALGGAGVLGIGLYSVFYGVASVEERVGVVVPARGLGGGRLDIWRMAWQHMFDQPLIGIGLNNFRFLPGADYHPHNYALQLFLETGVIGGALALGVLGVLVVELYRRARYNLAAVAGLAGVCGFLVAGLMNKSIFNPDWLIILIVVAVFGLNFETRAVPGGTDAD